MDAVSDVGGGFSDVSGRMADAQFIASVDLTVNDIFPELATAQTVNTPDLVGCGLDFVESEVSACESSFAGPALPHSETPMARASGFQKVKVRRAKAKVQVMNSSS